MSGVAREFLEAVLLALVVFLFIQTSVQNFKVEGSSMRPTLENGQFLLVNKVVYFKIDQERLSRIIPFWRVNHTRESFAVHPPKRGEVIVFLFPDSNPNNRKRDFVKRVVGLPGETVEIREGAVYINGEVLKDQYVKALGTRDVASKHLEEKEYYVLGDNRGGSDDSRSWGAVPEKNILGKVWLIVWPPSSWTLLQ
jgi:signal peptidase I